MSWWNRYVGIRWQEHGRDAQGCDCWGLTRLVLAQQFKIFVPSYYENYKSISPNVVSNAIDNEMEEWQHEWTSILTYSKHQAGDVLIWRILGFPSHISIAVEPRFFLHVEKGVNAVVEPIYSEHWRGMMDSAWRHRSLCP